MGWVQFLKRSCPYPEKLHFKILQSHNYSNPTVAASTPTNGLRSGLRVPQKQSKKSQIASISLIPDRPKLKETGRKLHSRNYSSRAIAASTNGLKSGCSLSLSVSQKQSEKSARTSTNERRLDDKTQITRGVESSIYSHHQMT